MLAHAPSILRGKDRYQRSLKASFHQEALEKEINTGPLPLRVTDVLPSWSLPATGLPLIAERGRGQGIEKDAEQGRSGLRKDANSDEGRDANLEDGQDVETEENHDDFSKAVEKGKDSTAELFHKERKVTQVADISEDIEEENHESWMKE
ncbi:hypothetical protein NDU88_005479 [Pleurodeles waltl]|uniref:Uncharacterized protein n=1 Tax=Pleurodeles waltl TaxID=8319 RepID=A0AAV7SLS4_PLEWA|nr:hypothetical protein NDU88_005479 [Pleurodeles waltl]